MSTLQKCHFSLSLPLSEDVRAARQRARQEICWTNSLRSSTTSLTQSLIQQASYAWCPETICSTGRRLLQIIWTFGEHSPIISRSSRQLASPFSWKKKKIRNICVRRCGSSLKTVFHLLFCQRSGCVSVLLIKLTRAVLLKPLSNACDCDEAMCVCFKMFTLSVHIYDYGVLFNDDMQSIHLHYTDW